MALPKIGDGEQLGDGNLNETLNASPAASPWAITTTAKSV